MQARRKAERAAREQRISDQEAPHSGSAIIIASWVGTGLFALTAILAVASPSVFAGPALAVSLTLFALGMAAFAWAILVAIARSTTDAIGIGGLFFLQGSAPRSAQLNLMGSLATEIVAAAATAAARPFTSLAFGTLVPLFGLGLAGLWGARHGVFDPRHEHGTS
ncbi:MAG: hypothetical protein JJLCMIEE_01859 [Acidimicrobiales bacterium]|nr:MAG: hypothetical protein EDR02_17135 [Actinomycetota bacterium]MBV6508793.1 hypothetical protein [Acidimicrobiales bacterium]RIK03657.1 MAG: hypothetical protein DCC48_16000 [Acidobacteriota bacterium]